MNNNGSYDMMAKPMKVFDKSHVTIVLKHYLSTGHGINRNITSMVQNCRGIETKDPHTHKLASSLSLRVQQPTKRQDMIKSLHES